MKYLSRVADKMLQERLETFGAVLIEGPKWTGKTTTAEQQAKSVIKLQDPDKAEEYLTTAATKPSLLLKGEQPRLIDEWQDAPYRAHYTNEDLPDEFMGIFGIIRRSFYSGTFQ